LKIAIYDLGEKVYNSALMQISAFHKKKGDSVEWYHPLMHDFYDKIYASALFEFTDKSYITEKMICGGSGFNLTTKLPKEIEECDYDYSIYPECKYSIIWFSKGCIRNCPFCIVRKKEGFIYPVDPKNLNPRGEYIEVMDNNFFANPNWKQAIKFLQEKKQPVKFNGIDARTITEEQLKILKSLRHKKNIYFAWDNPKDNMIPTIKKILSVIPAHKITFYVLIGFWSTEEEDLKRVEILRSYKIDPFVMPFNRSDFYQQSFARYVNHKATFHKTTWENYKRRVSSEMDN